MWENEPEIGYSIDEIPAWGRWPKNTNVRSLGASHLTLSAIIMLSIVPDFADAVRQHSNRLSCSGKCNGQSS